MLLHDRIRNRHRREKCPRIRVQRILVQLVAVGNLDNVAEVHHRDAVADMPHNGQVVRDEQVCQPELVLQVFQQVDYLRLNGHIQRGDWLVANDESRVDRQRARYADALALPAAEFVWVAVRHIRIESYRLQEFGNAVAVLLLGRGELMHDERLSHDVATGHARVQ